MMNRILILIFFCSSLVITQTEAQVTLNGVKLPAEISANYETLVLNGAGIRSKYFFNLYTAGLYLSRKSNDANAIIQADEVMAVRFQITSNMIDSENMTEAIHEGFQKSTGGKTAPIQDRIDNLLKAFSSEAIKIGDVFEIVYIPGVGTKTYKNGTLKSTVRGMDFKKALFGIWLSKNPVAKGLKKGMLGG